MKTVLGIQLPDPDGQLGVLLSGTYNANRCD